MCLRGRLVWEYYDELERICTEAIELSPNGPVVALNVPAGQWHTVRSLESGSVILEMKDGQFEPLQDCDVDCTVHTRYTKQTELDFEKHNAQCAEIKKVQLPQHIHARYLIVDDDVWLLGASVKDMGHGLCTVIKVGFTPEAVLGLLK